MGLSIRHRSSRTSLFGSIPEFHSIANFHPSNAVSRAASHARRQGILSAQHWRQVLTFEGKSCSHFGSFTRNITQAPAIMTLDGRGGTSTEWTARCRVHGNDRNHQAGLSHLDLINEHPFRERKQWCPFHDNLALRHETIFKRFLMEGTISCQPNLLL
jgi:hypothetical protein